MLLYFQFCRDFIVLKNVPIVPVCKNEILATFLTFSAQEAQKATKEKVKDRLGGMEHSDQHRVSARPRGHPGDQHRVPARPRGHTGDLRAKIRREEPRLVRKRPAPPPSPPPPRRKRMPSESSTSSSSSSSSSDSESSEASSGQRKFKYEKLTIQVDPDDI